MKRVKQKDDKKEYIRGEGEVKRKSWRKFLEEEKKKNKRDDGVKQIGYKKEYTRIEGKIEEKELKR